MPIRKKKTRKISKDSLVLEKVEYQPATEGIHLAKVTSFKYKPKEKISFKGEEKVKNLLEVKLELQETGKKINDRMIAVLSDTSKIGRLVKSISGEVPKKVDLYKILPDAIVGVDIKNNEKNGTTYSNVKNYVPADEAEEIEDDVENLDEAVTYENPNERVAEDEVEYEDDEDFEENDL